jgi:hypothetical protein
VAARKANCGLRKRLRCEPENPETHQLPGWTATHGRFRLATANSGDALLGFTWKNLLHA